MSTSSELTAQVGNAVAELTAAKNRFEAIRAETEQRVVAKVDELEDWKQSAFTSDEARNNLAQGSEISIDLTHLSDDVYYPVVLSGDAAHFCKYEVTRAYFENKAEASSLAGLFLSFNFTGFTWGGNPITLNIVESLQSYRPTAVAIGYVNYYKPCVFLAGGYCYRIRSNISKLSCTIYEQKTIYYSDPANPQHDSSIGPITLEVAQSSPAYISTSRIQNQNQDISVGQLGGF